ncbi:SpoIIE family protein phosphatase [Tahibacter sp.]|uniref:SpoIIE family protein phosphatase n=1 Tax=Tahibacter sp. TaxID=2056211 RepID=UPI0028C4419E|nr:SpoIIE family protein phosphatase [Tahibacter sp.]
MTIGRFAGLRGRFLLLVLGIFLGVGAVAAFGFFLAADRIIHSLGAGYATQYANQSRGRILARIQRELVLAQKLVDSPLLKRWAASEGDAELTQLSLAELDSYRKLFDDKSYFFIIDASRNYYFNNAANEFAGRELRYQMNPADPTLAWYFATMRNVDTFDLHVDNNPQLGVTKIWINAIVRGEDGRKLGVGGSGLDLSAFLKDIVRSTDAGVETWLVDHEGRLQGHPDSELIETNAATKDEAARRTAFDLVEDATERTTLKRELDALARDGRSATAQVELTVGGRRRLAAISYLPELRWATIVVVDPFQVTRLATFRPILILLATALLATIVLVSWLLNRLVLTRLARLTGHARAIAAGRYDTALKIDRPDEIGELTASFNHMTATIADYTQNLEAKVASRTQLLQESNALLAASNRKVMDSIEYARLIQSSLLPKPGEMARLFADYTVLWLPRDIVGGDFYALYPDGEDGCLLAVGDCTGHGVPGAFITMAAKALLDRAVATRGMDDPAALLEDLHRGLEALLGGQAGGSDNGLDLALLHVAPGRSRLRFAAARLALWIVQADGSLDTVKGERRSIGYRRGGATAFTNQDIAPRPQARYYLFTDGILDQNGGARGVALGRSRLAEALARGADRPLAAQDAALQQLLEDYRNGLPQRDDIVLLGVSLDRPSPYPRSSA